MGLFKSGAFLIQVNFNAFVFFGKQTYACLRQVASLIVVATMTGFTVFPIL